ncbi:MAG TPA: hypothetical protein VER55_04480, partial [Ardenticatenaceae bacterium]|nr:hypothetical protein [Ardenticatenaceae bacterium]
MHRPFRFGIVLAMVVLVISLRAATPGSAQNGTVIDRAGGDDYGVQVVLTTDGAPLPGGMASLTFEATPLMDAPDLLVVWEVPAGVELVGPARESLGPVAAGRTVRSQRQARFLAPGTHKVAVGAAYQPNAAAQFAASGVLFFDVGPGGSRVSTRNPHARQPGDTVFLTDVTVSPLAAGPHAPTGDPCFDVSGRIVRTDRMPRQTGLDPAADVPVQNVRVEIRESDTIADDNYGTVMINSDGTFAFPRFCDDDGVFDDELELYIRVWAEVYSGDFLVAEVVDGSAFDPTWEFISNIREHDESATLVFNLASTETQSAIFNILDSGFAAWSFWNASGGDVDGDRTFDDETEFEWAPDNDASGSNYQWWVGTEDITIADEPSDPDEWDDSVIIHEWNHFADDLYSCDDNPGGPHALGSLLDTELAWGEGYGDYYQSAVRSSRGFPDSQFYIENQGTTGLNFWVDLENQVDNNGNPLNVSVQDEMA